MKRRIAFLCALALLIGLFPAGAMAVETEADTYQAGYAIKDINPWVDYEDHSKGIQIELFNLTGNGDDSDRPVLGLYDDNGDGEQGDGDGIFTTCTAVTDPQDKTVLFVTIDAIGAQSDLVKDAKKAIEEKLGKNVISQDQIMISASHTHSGPHFADLRNKGDASQKAYYQHVIDQIAQAAYDAYHDRAPAELHKGTVNAKEATAELGYNGDNGYHMNAIRHYEVTMKKKNFWGTTTETKTYMTGSGDAIGTDEYAYSSKEYRTVDEADNDMHVLLFAFDDAEKQDIVFVNWRAHTTMNSGVKLNSNEHNGQYISSDYVNGLRSELSKEGYRTAFFQGASGNVVTTAREGAWSTNPENKDWIQYVDDKVGASQRDQKKTFIYGSMLAQIALSCIDEIKAEKPLPVGNIQTQKLTYEGTIQQDSEGLRAAAQAAEDNKISNYPYKYTHEDEKVYIVNSAAHKTNILSRATPWSGFENLELNAILFGNEVAFVTAPNELADKYHVYTDGDAYGSAPNDWDNLIRKTYGTPFVLGYTNASRSYIANWLDFAQNSQAYTDITGYADNGEEFFGPGTYESYICGFERGTGEDLVKTFGDMLKELSTVNSDYCEACKSEVQWMPLSSGASATEGHYYLTGNMTNVSCTNLGSGTKLCLDLNGYSMTCADRAFKIDGAELNIMDSRGDGSIVGKAAAGKTHGGVFRVAEDSVLNIYGGKFALNISGSTSVPTGGGMIYLGDSVLNMYGGTIVGADMRLSANGRGGAVYVEDDGQINMYGGSITSGQMSESGTGPCVYLASGSRNVTLSGNAQVGDIYYASNQGTNLTISGVYTGSAALTFAEDLAHGVDIGNAINGADITNATLTYTNNDSYKITISGTDLVLSTDVAKKGDTYYTSLQAAVNDSETGTIQLIAAPSDKAVTVKKNVYLDLNGFNVTGDIDVESGTLYCMDSQTDDYTVKDGNGYGKLTGTLTGDIQAVPVSNTKDGYLMVKEDDIGTSFHRVNLRLTHMVLRQKNEGEDDYNPGVYFKAEDSFAADEVVANKVTRYGVAMSVKGDPSTVDMEEDCGYSYFTDFLPGENGNSANGTLLRGVMKQTYPNLANESRANMTVYGSAYIQIGDDYMFGNCAEITFRDVVEAVDGKWNSWDEGQKNLTIAMYEKYSSFMKDWDIPNIIAASES